MQTAANTPLEDGRQHRYRGAGVDVTLFSHSIAPKLVQATGAAGSQIFFGHREWIAAVFQVTHTPSRIFCCQETMGIAMTDGEKKDRIGDITMLQGYMKVLMGGQNQGKLAKNQVFHSLEFQEAVPRPSVRERSDSEFIGFPFLTRYSMCSFPQQQLNPGDPQYLQRSSRSEMGLRLEP